MKILYVTTIGGTMGFFQDFIIKLLEQGHIVDIATNENTSKVPEIYSKLGCHKSHLSCTRSPFKIETIKTIRELRTLVYKNKYDIVHCHTPIAAMCTRVVCQPLRKKGITVMYTAHGFHFCKGAPLKNWLLFYPVEWICAHWTDVLITINEEDYSLAQKHMHAQTVKYVPGVGIDLEKFSPRVMSKEEKTNKRNELGLHEEEKLALSVGELSYDKNHILMLEALRKEPGLNYKYAICGEGAFREKYEEFIKENNLQDKVMLLGYRNDISELLQIADLFVFPSTFEGLPVALMEAIASKVMVVCSASRGNTDLVKDNRCLFDYRSVDELIAAIHNVENLSEEERATILEENYVRLLPREKSRIIEDMLKIYQEAERGDLQ